MVHQLIQRIDIIINLCWLHGALCGKIIFNDESQIADWVNELAGRDCRCSKKEIDGLADWLQEIKSELGEVDFQLPQQDDEEALAERVQNFSNWTEGFLMAFCASGVATVQVQDPETEAFLEILGEINLASQNIDPNALEQEAEMNERDFMELLEYVRMNVVYNFENQQPVMESKSLH